MWRLFLPDTEGVADVQLTNKVTEATPAGSLQLRSLLVV